MNSRRAAGIGILAAITLVFVWTLFVGLPRWYGRARQTDDPAAPSAASAGPGRKINARLFYVADDGVTLTSVEREVPYAEGAIAQAKAIVEAQIAAVDEPLVSAVPEGTTLRALFITESGEAYVDFSPELVSRHPGGSTNELLTIYTLVDVLTVNLPAITSVQLLVDGKEVDTLAGHVDLRRPLLKRAQLADVPKPDVTVPEPDTDEIRQPSAEPAS